jgi:hypothetical protein
MRELAPYRGRALVMPSSVVRCASIEVARA